MKTPNKAEYKGPARINRRYLPLGSIAQRNRWTGQPHSDGAEITRRQKQYMRIAVNRSQRAIAKYGAAWCNHHAKEGQPVGISRRGYLLSLD